MTTSELSSLPKGLIVEYTSSSLYRDITPSSLPYMRRCVENGRGESRVYIDPGNMETDRVKKAIFDNCTKCRDKMDSPTFAMCSLSQITLSYNEVIALLERIQRIVLGSEEGMGEFLNKAFDSDQGGKVSRRGMELGTLRFYSDDLMCFWTGKNWRKIDRSEAK